MRTPELWEQVHDLEKRVAKLEESGKPIGESKPQGEFKTIYTGMRHGNDMVNFVTYCSICSKTIVDTERKNNPDVREYRYCPFCGAMNTFRDPRL